MADAAVQDPPVTPAADVPPVVPGTPPVPPADPKAVVPPASEPPAAPPAPPTAPVSYTLALPDKGVLDQSDLDVVTAMATDKGWTNEQAQTALNELNANLQAQAQAFKVDLDAHPEIGGAKFQAAQEHALRALDKFLPANTPEGAAFRTAMNKSGYGNYAPLMLFMSRIGKAMAEDKPLGGTATTPDTKPKSIVNQLYGKTTPEPE